jgi:cytochrome P450
MTYSHLARANDLEPSVGHHHLLENCPYHREEAFDPPFHVVSRHADVLAMLLAPTQWRNGDGPGVFVQTGGVLGAADDPDHRRQRRVLQDGFRPAAVSAMSVHIDEIGRRLWDRAFSHDGEGDFVRLFSFPFPAEVIAELLGVRPEDREKFGEWSDDIVDGLGGGDLSRVERANVGIYEIVDRLVEERRRALEAGVEPPDDLVTVMTRAVLEGELSHGEVRRLSQQILVAGHETTASLISLMLYRLIQDPELFARLRQRPDLLEPAVEEFLRFDSPVQGLFRSNREACRLGDSEISPGTKVQLLFAAANRDPRVWDRPDAIDPERFAGGGRSHLAFGWGVHHCIGNALARHEARFALRAMLDSFEEIELTGDVAVNSPFILRGLTTLPVRWRVRSSSSLSNAT